MDLIQDVNTRQDGVTGIPQDSDPEYGGLAARGDFQGKGTGPGPRTTAHAYWFNMITLEMKHLVEGLGATPNAPDVHQLAKLCERSHVPTAANGVLIAGSSLVAVGDMGTQRGYYQRYGDQMTYSLTANWTNTDGGLTGDALRIELPFLTSDASGTPGVSVAPVFRDFSGFGADDTEVFYEVSAGHASPQSQAFVVSSAAVRVGADARQIGFTLQYAHNGVRNPLWPAVEWDVVGDWPNASTLDFTYYGAQAGDFISVRDKDDIEVQSIGVGALPSATLTTAALSPSVYTLVHRGFRSYPVTIAP